MIDGIQPTATQHPEQRIRNCGASTTAVLQSATNGSTRSRWLYDLVVRFFVACLLISPIARLAAQTTPSADEPVLSTDQQAQDPIRAAQQQAGMLDFSPAGYWGTDPARFTGWKTHSNRLIPVYTFGTRNAGPGIDLSSYTGDQSPYRSKEALQKIYGFVPEFTVDSTAEWMDQTNLYDLQRAASQAGRRYIFVVIFDGMDWQSTRLASIANSHAVTYGRGRGHGTHFQDYTANGTTQFGLMVTSPHNNGTDVNPTTQEVNNPGGTLRGGYAAAWGGRAPWLSPADDGYLIGKPAEGHPQHAYTDSSSSATSMTAGIKTYNGALNVDATGVPVTTIAHQLQEQGWAVGAVSSVPISHATPAAAYAHNVSRDDYQDLTRDMLGLPSIQHPTEPLAGMDVVIGGGYGVIRDEGLDEQGENFVPGNVFLTDDDLQRVDVQHGGLYVTAIRSVGVNGTELLQRAAREAASQKRRLLGFFGNGNYNGHLPFATADGRFDPAKGLAKKPEEYTAADLLENPHLADMTTAAIEVLASRGKPFWLMVEPGDVDWANHDDNFDSSIGAVNSGDAAVRVITDWVEANSNWQESLLIVTADHGHYFNLVDPGVLLNGPPDIPIPETTPESGE